MSIKERNPSTGQLTDIAGSMSVDNLKNLLLDMVYPIGSVYMSFYNVSPASFLGGTWMQLSGYMLRAANSGVTPNNNAKDGGEDTVTLTVDQIPAHNHPMASNGRPITIGTNYDQIAYNEGFQHSNGNWWGNNHKGESDIGYRGGSKAHNNVPNYKNVYIWERTA